VRRQLLLEHGFYIAKTRYAVFGRDSCSQRWDNFAGVSSGGRQKVGAVSSDVSNGVHEVAVAGAEIAENKAVL
jgi:hypothetical protein